ncbi:MAG: hypothetical protein ACTSRS_20400 [Candidatus Helarchaeota archaeon]
MEYTLWLAFITGIVSGFSACFLLLVSVLGASLTLGVTRNKYFRICIALIIGVIGAFLIASALFLLILDALTIITYVKVIFGGVFLFIGIWQVLEFQREASIIFGTPTRLKVIINTFIEKKSELYAFFVGMIFIFVKIPCIGALYLNLLVVAKNDPLLGWLIFSYFIGLLLPIFGILITIRIGFQSERVNKFRLTNRPYLRLLSGCLLITLSIYILFDAYFPLELLFWLILGEIFIFIIFFIVKSRKTPSPNELD